MEAHTLLTKVNNCRQNIKELNSEIERYMRTARPIPKTLLDMCFDDGYTYYSKLQKLKEHLEQYVD